MSRLVVVSNRVADLDNPKAGGLAVGVGDGLKANGGVWFGWNGNIEEPGAGLGLSISRTGNVQVATMGLSQQDYDEFYVGYSNSVLWPMLHYRLDLVKFETAQLDGYKRVNQRFADALSPLLEENDLVWIHDYHLIPLASELRKRGHGQKIGFFLHIPFAPPDILSATPEHRWLMTCLFSYDVVGVQSRADLNNLKRYVVDEAGGTVSDDGTMSAFGSTIHADAFPIGINVESFRDIAEEDESQEVIATLRRRTLDRTMIIGVDRLDYSKGLPDRLRAFERLLELYPENRKTVTFMQIAPPTRENVDAYADIREELEKLSGAINGRFADFDWTPLRYIHRNIAREKLAPLFRASKVGFVSPLRDGMNLVAKEYIAAQNPDDPGVLVLSKFAGAAEELEEALIVNPYDVDEMAGTLQRALRMNLEERQERQAALLKRIRANDAHHWQSRFLSALEATGLSPSSAPS
ncbi:MAG: trehalose-6-phosphate synthase [Pseudomonadota bacterium]